ncbi:uncharacterized protein N7484_004923 [Penicillium longicatenatum]|uniref:uncharacterized protein n=1 Tax=Penicillium longicatenatum TaxID=1561947 RepID=UPI0025497B0B|nr:uncharacterized protein N7484_004923 [Penicillium longicatenatum]KAJ5651200.1 hypothetical protein N7484_004923 [Penicillium longicatenatum]
MADGFSPTSPPPSPSLLPHSPPDSPAFIAFNNGYDQWNNLIAPDEVNGFDPTTRFDTLFNNPPALALPVTEEESAEPPGEQESLSEERETSFEGDSVHTQTDDLEHLWSKFEVEYRTGNLAEFVGDLWDLYDPISSRNQVEAAELLSLINFCGILLPYQNGYQNGSTESEGEEEETSASDNSEDSKSDSGSDDESTGNPTGTPDNGYGAQEPSSSAPNRGPSNPGNSYRPPQILGKRRRRDSPDHHKMSSKLKEEQPSGSFHQDYIASLRYRNDLPPPDMPPKFLDIPHEGLSRFLTPGFASNLARREEPNIDVDAEGGMPIDMVGIPGLHLGDESAIMAPENPQPIDPADLPLLMALDQLRNPAPKNTNVSFLRRTQHISVERSAPSGSGSTTINAQSRPLKKTKVSVDDPKHVKKLVQKGFDVAYPESKYTGEDTESHIRGLPATKAEIDAWANPVHPDNPKLKAVGFFAVLPDLEGFTDPGGLVQFKFDKAPVSAVGGKRDKRMDVALLHPSAPEDRICEEHAQKVALHKANPEVYPDPGPIPWDYDLFLSEKSESVKKIGISMDPKNPNRDNEDLYAHEGTEGHKFHRYDRVRTYATSAQTLNTDQKQRDIALTLFQPNEGETKQQAAYYYPILGKTRLKPERARTIAQAGLAPTASLVKEDQIDQMQVAVRDPDEAEVYKRALHRANIDPEFAKTLGPPPEPPVAEQGSPDALGDEVAGDDEDTRMSEE